MLGTPLCFQISHENVTWAGHKFILWKEFQDTPHIVISNKTPKTEKISCYDNNSENCTHVRDQKSL